MSKPFPVPNLPVGQPFLRKKQTVALIGDSITHAFPDYGWWMHFQQYLVTRYPLLEMRTLNLSTIGITVGKTLRRFAQEFDRHAFDSALVYLGMNDSIHTQPQNFRRDYELLLDRLAERKANVLGLIAPPAYDDQSSDALVAPGDSGHNNRALEWIDQSVAEIGREHGLPVARQFETYRSLQARLLRQKPPLRLMGMDRIHPGPLGAAITFIRVLEALGLPGQVWSVSLEGDLVRSRHGSVSGLERNRQGVRFCFSPFGLPFPETEAATQAEQIMNLRQSVSSQLLCVKGLPAGGYRLLLDGVLVCSTTADQLEQGLDLVGLDTLWQRQANLAGRWVLRLCQCQTELRDMRRAEYYAMGQEVTGEQAMRDYMRAQLDGDAFSNRQKQVFRNYLGNRLTFQQRYDLLDQLWQTAYQSAQPLPAIVEIQKN